MRSAQVEMFDRDHELSSGYSDLMVMQSAAGYYVGTTYTHADDDPEVPGLVVPGSRDSHYMDSEEEASRFLAYMQS